MYKKTVLLPYNGDFCHFQGGLNLEQSLFLTKVCSHDISELMEANIYVVPMRYQGYDVPPALFTFVVGNSLLKCCSVLLYRLTAYLTLLARCQSNPSLLCDG